jgi:hypothetical protein
VVALDADFGTAIMRGHFYLYFQSLIVDLFGALVLVGVGLAAARRYISRPKRLVYTTKRPGFSCHCLDLFAGLSPWKAGASLQRMIHGPTIRRSVICRSPLVPAQRRRFARAHRFVWWFHLLLSFRRVGVVSVHEDDAMSLLRR